MENKKDNPKEVKPIEIKKNKIEENLKTSDSNEILAKAIKSMLNKGKK